MASSEYSVLEYLYRDAGNFKAWGLVLLEGAMTAEDERALRDCFVDGMYFDATQLGVPSLREELWASSGSSYSAALDHGWHELSDVRVASPDEVRKHPLWGNVKKFIAAACFAAMQEVSVSRGGKVLNGVPR